MKRNTATLTSLLLAAIIGFVLIEKPEPREAAPSEVAWVDGGEVKPKIPEEAPRIARRQPQQQPAHPAAFPSIDLPPDFLDRPGKDHSFRVDLPDDREAKGTVVTLRRDADGVSMIEGRLSEPEAGRFFFLRQNIPGVAGSLVGHILFDRGDAGWKVEPVGPGGAPRLVETGRDGVICANYAMPAAAAATEEAPAAHPIDIPIPAYQEIVPLQSLPGAAGVIYLDFDGEEGPFPSWGEFDAASPNVTNAQVHAVWKMVCEDFQGFTLNITTDRKVFDEAAPGSRQHVIITPTTTASPGAGGVAYIGSYNWVADVPCWAFYSTGKYSAEVISHEVGHALGLSHDGRTAPVEDYYLGHGSGETGWAPIMGAGYYENVTQWSKGEYAFANRTQDDVAIIVTNNHVQFRTDDTGDDEGSASELEILPDESVTGEGIIETRFDVDAYRFRSTGGLVNLQVHPVGDNPNLDVLAELVDVASGDYIASSHPDLELAAGIEMELPPGEYVLEISGTGRGSPLVDGYSDYGSMGTYSISGSVAGGVKPDRFTIAENSGAGLILGTIAPRNDHGSEPLVWSIDSGNESGAFTIDAVTGIMSVANPGVLDFESLSSRWDDPATFELFITISDGSAPGLDETIRVVVTLSDVNDPPVVLPASLTVLERTRAGIPLIQVESSDPDHFDLPSYAIIGGNEAGWFTIDSDSGIISTGGNGIGEVGETATVALQIEVSDLGAPVATGTATVTLTIIGIPDGHFPGGVMRTYFEDIAGYEVADLTAATQQWPDHPDREELLPDFDGGDHGDNFGSALRGYFIPPVSGNYRFWIASDGASELWLDSTPGQTGATEVASVMSSTDEGFWIDTAPFRSSQISLTAGQAYAIEARHKESFGPDHVSVAFSGPGIPKQLLRGLYLAPKLQNYAPSIAPTGFAIGEDAYAGQRVGTVAVADVNGADQCSGFTILAGNGSGAFSIDPSSGEIRIASGGILDAGSQPTHTLSIGVTDNGSPPLTGSGEITVTILPPGTVTADGLKQQVWTAIEGSSITDLTDAAGYPHFPGETRTLASFDSGQNIGDNYGSRIRALVTPPATGYYTFYLASNDQAKLQLGLTASAASASQIASVSGWTNYGQWTKYASQESDPVHLVAGTRYYIETLQKEGLGSDHVQVAWTGPGIASPTVIPASSLAPYDINVPPLFEEESYAFSIVEGAAAGTALGTLTATDPEGETLFHAILAGNPTGAYMIDPATGVLRVANPSALTVGQHHLTIGAQDGGLGREYPFKAGEVTLTVTVLSDNLPPQFAAEAIFDSVQEDANHAASFAALDPDAGDVVQHVKVSGPEWLTVESDGSVHGMPGNGDVGMNVFVLRATDSEGLFDEMELSIAVENTNDAPFFTEPSLTLSSAIENEPFQASLQGTATDIDPDDGLSFSKESGPAWLTIAADGSMSGTPGDGDTGENEFQVRVTDLAGAQGEAVLRIPVIPVNDPPGFVDPVIPGPSATENEPFAGTLAPLASDPDAGDVLVFTKIAGPEWLTVEADGSFSGVPADADAGTNIFTVSVTDPSGERAEATLTISVASVNDAPVFPNDPITGTAAREGEPYVADALVAMDEDAGDALAFSKEAGPEWLAVAEDGALSGIPPVGSAGTQVFTIRATDPAGLHAEATLVIEVLAEGLPLPWDGGTVGIQESGSSAVNGQGEFMVAGAGQLAGREDSFQFVWQPLSGDGVITARIVSMDDSGPLARAGVMIRDTLASNSRHVFLGLSGDGSFRWVRRTGYNGNTSTNTSGTAALPDAWVRLVRRDSTITAYKSVDGTNWVQIGSLNAALPETCYFGLAVAGGSSSLLNEARFSNVSLTP
jgi:hypothetical protein